MMQGIAFHVFSFTYHKDKVTLWIWQLVEVSLLTFGFSIIRSLWVTGTPHVTSNIMLISQPLICYISIRLIMLLLFRVAEISNVYEKYQRVAEKTLVSLLEGDSFNPIRWYVLVYLLWLLVLRAFFCWVSDSAFRLSAFGLISMYLQFAIIFNSKDPYLVTVAFVAPIVMIILDVRSSVVADFFRKHPHLLTKLLESPLLSGGGPNGWRRGMFRRVVRNTVNTLGGPKVVLTGVALVVGGCASMALQHHHHNQDLAQADNHHIQSMENNNRQYAMDKKMTAEYQSMDPHNPLRQQIDYILKTGHFPE